MMKLNILERDSVRKVENEQLFSVRLFWRLVSNNETHCTRQRVPVSGRFGGPTFAGPPSEHIKIYGLPVLFVICVSQNSQHNYSA